MKNKRHLKMFKYFLNHLVLLCLLIVGCSKHSDISVKSKVDYSLYDEIIKNIDTDTYNEIDWMTSEPTGGFIVFKECLQKDIDGDGIDELFVLRQYVNPNNIVISKDDISSLESFNKYAIRQSFIAESYRIVNSKAENITIGNEPVSTQAFAGGHFGTFYFLFDDGKIAKYDNSYWEENLAIYDKLKFETLISYTGDMNTGEWVWEIDKNKINKSDVIKIIKNIDIYGR